MAAYVVVCLEGAHGSGKTRLTEAWRDAGFPCLEESFMNSGGTLLDRQSLFSETAWVCGWMQRAMSKVIELRASGSPHHVIVADRSPFSAVLYSKSDGALLEPLIRQFVRELREVAGVEIVCVHLRTRRDLLWRRILERLRVEPERIALREDSEAWMDSVLALYDGMAWDATVPNDDDGGLDELRGRVLCALAEAASSPDARSALRALAAAASGPAAAEGSAAESAATPARPHCQRVAAAAAAAAAPPMDAPSGTLGVRMALNPAEVSPTQPLPTDAAYRGGGMGAFGAAPHSVC